MKLKILPFITLILVSCQDSVGLRNNEQIIKEKSIVKVPKTNDIELTIEDKIVETLNRDNFITDTNRLKKIAQYAYFEIRKTPFIEINGRTKNPLDANKHSMSKFGLLKTGISYYFVKQDSTGKPTDLDLTIEIWTIDSSKNSDIEIMKNAWIEKYYPMPAYIVKRKDTIVFFNTRSGQFASVLEKYVNVIK